jgi:transcriptional regulator with XRE-family HTH domain
MKFGEKLRLQRKNRSLLQEDVAKSIGVTSKTLGHYENGIRHPKDRATYFKLAEMFCVDVNYFLTEDEEFLTAAAEAYGKRGQMQAKEILEQTAALFAGGGLSERDRLAFQMDMMQLFFEAKAIEKDKHTQHKAGKNKPAPDTGDMG